MARVEAGPEEMPRDHLSRDLQKGARSRSGSETMLPSHGLWWPWLCPSSPCTHASRTCGWTPCRTPSRSEQPSECHRQVRSALVMGRLVSPPERTPHPAHRKEVAVADRTFKEVNTLKQGHMGGMGSRRRGDGDTDPHAGKTVPRGASSGHSGHPACTAPDLALPASGAWREHTSYCVSPRLQ